MKRKNDDAALGALVGLLLFAVPTIGCIALCSGFGTRGEPKAQAQSNLVAVGEIGVMDGDSLVGMDSTAGSRLTQLSNAKDDHGIVEMLRDGRAFIVEEGTRVRVIQRDVFTIEIRVQEGKQEGKSGWVPFEFVKPMR